MKVIALFRGVIISLLFGGWVHAQARVDDPSAVKPEPKEEESKVFTTTAGHKVMLLPEKDYENLLGEDRPKIEEPLRFDRHFESPEWVRSNSGGYFAAYDGGEWGGALFYAQDKDKQWTLLIDRHIQGLGRFSSSTFLAVGGLAHMGFSGGTVYLISQTSQGKWKARKVYETTAGKPILIGTSMIDLYDRPGSKQLFVIGLEYPKAGEPLMGVDEDGVVYYLGERVKAKEKEEKQGP